MHNVSEDAAVLFLPPSLAKARQGGRPAVEEAGHQETTGPGADMRGKQEREESRKKEKEETQKENSDRCQQKRHGIG